MGRQRRVPCLRTRRGGFVTQEQNSGFGSAASSAPGLARCSTCQTLHHPHVLLAACPGCGVLSSAMMDHDLVDALYRAYAVPLLRFVQHLRARHGMSESLLDTEGVVHEAFTAILRSRDTIENPRGWLFAVTARLARKRVAEHQLRQAGGAADDFIDSGAARWSSLPPQADAEDICQVRQVLEDIAELPNSQMVAVYLHHVQGWTAKEIGEYLKCAASTAGVHIHRGTKRLRRDNHSPARRRIRTLGKIGLAVLVGGIVVDQLIRLWTWRSFSGCSGGHPSPCPPSKHWMPPEHWAPPDSAGSFLWTAAHPVVVLVAVAVLALGAIAMALTTEPRWRAIRRRRPHDNTRAPEESSVTPNDPTNT
jgi:RNA polymerase sigma factor (sigma-70 family)